MKPSDIRVTDLRRIFIGEVPSEFFLEIAFRASVTLFLILLAMRLMGKRFSGQLSRNEMAAIVSLAAAVGIPLLTPDRGLLPGLISVGVVVFVQNLVAKLATGNKRLERMSLDHLDTLVSEGAMDLSLMKKNRISVPRLFAELRWRGLVHLGQVKRLYFEANGDFTLIRKAPERPGLSILPDWDADFRQEFSDEPTMKACLHCGFSQHRTSRHRACLQCSHDDWTRTLVAEPLPPPLPQ